MCLDPDCPNATPANATAKTVPICKACGLLIFAEPIYLQGDPYHVAGCFAAGLKHLRRVLRPLIDVDCSTMNPQAAFQAGLEVASVPPPARKR
jgi:hypothetical protein